MSTDIQQNINSLIDSRKSLLIASLNEHGLPEISTTPFVKVDDKFYIFISELAAHTQNIQRQAKLSLMLLEDEQDTKNAFARKRLSYECVASFIERQHFDWNGIMDCFEEKHGNTIRLLKQLQDFHLVELSLCSGNYVEGFGKAYRLSSDSLSQITLQTKS